ncbi:MAG: PKD domain-containing protein [Saprospirales bacterium]|nr:MAG: PKD domain-containing protein [Saprospirales bacterium]
MLKICISGHFRAKRWFLFKPIDPIYPFVSLGSIFSVPIDKVFAGKTNNLKLKTHIAVLFLFLFSTTFLSVALASHEVNALPGHIHPPEADHVFRENKGQWPENVLYRADFGNVQIWAERGSLLWVIQDTEDLKARAACKFDPDCSFIDFPINNYAFRMHFEGSNKDYKHFGTDPSVEYFNYLRGNDPDKWASEVKEFRKVTYENIYDGIDYVIYLENGVLKYDFIVQPGADPSKIKMVYEGLHGLKPVFSNLLLKTPIQNIFEQPPYTYQVIDEEEVYVPSEFVISDSAVGFNFPAGYEPGLPLIIDPVLIFSTYSGSVGDNWGTSATPGPNGDLYGAGTVFEQGYPTTVGAFQSSYAGSSIVPGYVDMGITRFSADGSQRVFSTYIGGVRSDVPHSLIMNSRGELVIMGISSSPNFPVTIQAFQRQYGGGQPIPSQETNGILIEGSDIVVVVLNTAGTGLIGSTFVGGSGNDGINAVDRVLGRNYGDQFRGEVVVDDEDNIYIASVTQSGNFPIRAGALQSGYPGGILSGVAFSLNRTCSELRWSTYLGGEGADAAYSIKLDNAGNVFIAGGTRSNNFPTTGGSFKTNYQGGQSDGFVAKLNSNGGQLLAGTFIGTNDYDQVYFVEIDDQDRVYLLGQSLGRMNPTEGVYSNQNSAQFIKRLDNNLSNLEFRTVFGSRRGSIDISPTALMVDRCNRIYTSGWGGNVNSGRVPRSSTNGLPVTPDAFQSTTDGSDFYFFVLEEDATDLIYATFFGGSRGLLDPGGDEHVDGGTSRFSRDGTIYQAVCAGCGGSNNFPTTNGVVAPNNLSFNCNLGVVKYDFELDEITARASLRSGSAGCAPFTADFRNQSTGTIYFEWDFGDGNSSQERAPIHQFEEPGTYEVKLIALSRNTCLEPDTVLLTVEVKEPPASTIEEIEICENNPLEISSQIDEADAEYMWSTGQSSQSITVFQSGIYSVEARLDNCIYRDSFIIVNSVPTVTIRDSIACDQSELSLNLDPRAENIIWNTGSEELSIVADEAGLYWVNYSIGNCNFSDSAFITFPISPEIRLIGDSTSCEGQEVELLVIETKDIAIKEFSWSTDQIGSQIVVTETGTYKVEALSEEGCTDEAEIFVFFLPPLPEAVDFSDTLICADGFLLVDFTEFEELSDIIWSDGSEDFFRVFNESKILSYEITNVCENLDGTVSLEKSPFEFGELPVFFPNAFSPNQDGINDIFRPEFAPEVQIISFEMKVFDRWGNKVFETFDMDFGWNGNFDTDRMDPAVFAWIAEIEFFVCDAPVKKRLEGDVSIMR